MPKIHRRRPQPVGKEPLLLCTPDFVPISTNSRHEDNPGECKADALTG
jgi:hypothetical protein